MNGDGTCTPHRHHAARGTRPRGNSGGWQQWSVNLDAYAGKQVEVSIAYASDWGTQDLGVFVDDIDVSTGEGSTSFETGLDGWPVTGPPAGSAANANNWIRTDAAGFPVGAAITTPRLDHDGLRVRGHLDAGGAQRGHGPSDGAPVAVGPKERVLVARLWLSRAARTASRGRTRTRR